jgi:tetratricopeptide (TPR) repeat protein
MNRHDAALALLESEIARDPDNVQLLVLLGSVHAGTEEPGLAAAAFDRAIQADPANPEGYLARAQLHLVSAELGDAEAMARAGLARDEDSATLRLLLASVLEAAEDYEGAIAEYESILAVDPRSPVAANNLASLLSEHRTDAESLERAHALATRFRNAEIPQFLDTLGWIYHRRGDQAAALSVLKTAADRLPDSGPVQYHLGMTLKELGQADLALLSLEKAVALAPSETTPYLAGARSAIAQLRSAPAAGSVSN